MSIARVGNITGVASTISSVTIGSVAAPVGAAATVGRLIVVAIAKDNTSTTGADNNEVTSVLLRNSADNTTKLTLTKLKERTNAGTAAAGATVSLWFGILPPTVAATDFIKATFSLNIVAKVMTGEIFSLTAGSTVAADPQTTAAENDAAVLASIAVTPTNTSGPAVNGRLVIRASAVENNAAAWTGATSGWTNFTEQKFTASGAAAANMSGGAEFKIGAGNVSTDVYTSAPTGSVAADGASVIGALYEILAPVLAQRAFRFYGPGAENAQPPLAAQNTNYTYDVAAYPNTHFNLRVLINETGGIAWPVDYFQLEMSWNGGAWFIAESITNPGIFDAPLTTNGQATTNQLTSGTGTFGAGVVLENSSGNAGPFTASGFTELLWPLFLTSAGLNNGDYVDFRVTKGGFPLSAYTVMPRLTISVPGGKIKARVGGAWVDKPVKVRLAGAWVVKPLKVYKAGVGWILS